MNSTNNDAQAAAFRALLAIGQPVSASGVAAGLGTWAEESAGCNLTSGEAFKLAAQAFATCPD